MPEEAQLALGGIPAPGTSSAQSLLLSNLYHHIVINLVLREVGAIDLELLSPNGHQSSFCIQPPSCCSLQDATQAALRRALPTPPTVSSLPPIKGLKLQTPLIFPGVVLQRSKAARDLKRRSS